MCVSALAGCNLIGRDDATYYNAVVATLYYNYELNGETIKEKENITKRELITAVKSYGDKFNASTQKETIEKTLDALVNQKLMIKDVEIEFKKNNEKLFNDRETSYLWQSTYDAIFQNLQKYYNEVLGITDESGDTQEEENTGVYNKYNPNAFYYTYPNSKGELQYGVKKTTSVATVSGRYTVLYDENNTPYNYELKKDGKYPFKDLIYSIIKDYTKDSQWQSAFNKYIEVVKDNYSYVDFETNDDVFYFELDRIYKIVRDNYVIEKYEEIYNRAAENGSTLTNVRINKMIDYFESKTISDYLTYRNNQEAYQNALFSTSTNTFYNYQGSGATRYFNVGVIKLNFKEGQETPEDLDAKVENEEFDPANGKYEEELDIIYEQVYANIKDDETGKNTGEKILASDLQSEIEEVLSRQEYQYKDYETIRANQDDVKAILKDYGKQDLTEENNKDEIDEIVRSYVDERNQRIAYDRADAFIKYYYYYNDDTTYQNIDKTAVFGISSTGDVVYNTTFSEEDNEDFEKALKELYEKNEVGAISDVIRADDGVYILFYAGEVKNVFDGVTENFSLSNQDIEKLASTRVNIFNNKTYFDLVYDTVYSENNFADFELENLNYLKKQITDFKEGKTGIEYFLNEYKDLF